MKKTQSPKILVAGYIRVSSEPQAIEEKSSLEIQREAIQKYAQEHGFSIFRFYEDHESGKKVDRTHYQEMKEDAKAGQFKRVLFHKWDRFGRNAKEVLTAHDDLKEIGVDIVCVAQNVDTSTGHGRFFMTQLAAFAELEWTQIRERTLSGLRARAKLNLKIGSPPLGYSWNEDAKKFEINPEEAEIYEQITSLYLEKGLSQTQIASYLNEKGIRTRKGKKRNVRPGRKILQSTIGIILRNPAYLGKYHYSFQGEDHEIPVPPLIDRKRWDLIQQKSRENFSRGTRSRNFPQDNDPYILRDVLKCGECGYGIMASTKKHRRVHTTSTDRYYVCYLRQARTAIREQINFKPGKPHSCPLPFLPAELLERQIKGMILSHFQFPQNLVRRWKEKTGSLNKADIESKLKGSKIRLGKLEAKRDEYWTLFNESEIDRGELKKQEGLLKSQIENLKIEIGESEKELSQNETREEDLRHLTETASQIKAIFPAINKAISKLTNQQWKDLIRTGLGGERLTVSIARRRDALEQGEGPMPKNLDEPLYREASGQKFVEWKIEGDWNFNLDVIAQYLQPLTKLNNRRWRTSMEP
jgi:DNA invertase Pin-like site-specific DNA recombinase